MSMIVVREDWLAQSSEEAIEPTRRIVDPHHHFFAHAAEFPDYDLEQLWADTDTHKMAQTVYLQCWEGYRQDGPEDMKCVGETAWVDGIAARARQRPQGAQICAARERGTCSQPIARRAAWFVAFDRLRRGIPTMCCSSWKGCPTPICIWPGRCAPQRALRALV